MKAWAEACGLRFDPGPQTRVKAKGSWYKLNNSLVWALAPALWFAACPPVSRPPESKVFRPSSKRAQEQIAPPDAPAASKKRKFPGPGNLLLLGARRAQSQGIRILGRRCGQSAGFREPCLMHGSRARLLALPEGSDRRLDPKNRQLGDLRVFLAFGD